MRPVLLLLAATHTHAGTAALRNLTTLIRAKSADILAKPIGQKERPWVLGSVTSCQAPQSLHLVYRPRPRTRRPLFRSRSSGKMVPSYASTTIVMLLDLQGERVIPHRWNGPRKSYLVLYQAWTDQGTVVAKIQMGVLVAALQ